LLEVRERLKQNSNGLGRFVAWWWCSVRVGSKGPCGARLALLISREVSKVVSKGPCGAHLTP